MVKLRVPQGTQERPPPPWTPVRSPHSSSGCPPSSSLARCRGWLTGCLVKAVSCCVVLLCKLLASTGRVSFFWVSFFVQLSVCTQEPAAFCLAPMVLRFLVRAAFLLWSIAALRTLGSSPNNHNGLMKIIAHYSQFSHGLSRISWITMVWGRNIHEVLFCVPFQKLSVLWMKIMSVSQVKEQS